MKHDHDERMLEAWCGQLSDIQNHVESLRRNALNLSHAIAVKAREVRGERWKQKTVAQLAGISQSHLSKLENYHPSACPLIPETATKLINASLK